MKARDDYVLINYTSASFKVVEGGASQFAYNYQKKQYGTSLALGLEVTNEVNENKETVYRFTSIVEKKTDVKFLKNIEHAYSFVVVNYNEKPALRIGPPTGHYYLANEASSVFAAGEIFIQSIEEKDVKSITAGDAFSIVEINDKSGGYNLLYSNQQSNEKVDNETYRQSIKKVFESVGLPFFKMKFYEEKPQNNQTSSADGVVSDLSPGLLKRKCVNDQSPPSFKRKGIVAKIN